MQLYEQFAYHGFEKYAKNCNALQGTCWWAVRCAHIQLCARTLQPTFTTATIFSGERDATPTPLRYGYGCGYVMVTIADPVSRIRGF